MLSTRCPVPLPFLLQHFPALAFYFFLKIIFNCAFFSFARHIRLPFCDAILLFLCIYKYILDSTLRCYDARILNKRFLWRSYVEIQMVQKLVVNEKVVKMREFLKHENSNLHYTRGITPKRVISDLRGLAPGLHSTEKTSQRYRVVGNTLPI